MSGIFRLKRQIEIDRRDDPHPNSVPAFVTSSFRSRIGADAENHRIYGGESKKQQMATYNAKKKEKMALKKKKSSDSKSIQTVDKESQLYGVKMSSQRKKEKKATLRKKNKSNSEEGSFIYANDHTTFVNEVTHKEKQEDVEDEIGEEQKDKKLAWEPEEILANLENPQSDGFNLMKVIGSIQGKNLKEDTEEYVWDGGATEKGKRSNQNFFMWLEAFTAHESEKQKMIEEGVFSV